MASAGQETVFASEGQKAGMESHQVAVVLSDGRCEIVIPEFACDSAQELESVEVTAHEGLEALAVRELHKQLAAVTFHQTEGIELARVTLVEKCTEVPPVDFEALSRSWLHAHIGTLGRGLQLAPRVSNLSGCSDRRSKPSGRSRCAITMALAFASCSNSSAMVALNGSSLLARCRRAALRAGVTRYWEMVLRPR